MNQKNLTILGIVIAITGLVMAFFSWRHRHMHTMKDGFGILALGIAIMLMANFEDFSDFFMAAGCVTMLVGFIIAIASIKHAHLHTAKSGWGILAGGALIVALSYFQQRSTISRKAPAR